MSFISDHKKINRYNFLSVLITSKKILLKKTVSKTMGSQKKKEGKDRLNFKVCNFIKSKTYSS